MLILKKTKLFIGVQLHVLNDFYLELKPYLYLNLKTFLMIYFSGPVIDPYIRFENQDLLRQLTVISDGDTQRVKSGLLENVEVSFINRNYSLMCICRLYCDCSSMI